MPSRCVIELEVLEESYELEMSGDSSIDFEHGEYISVHSTEYPTYEGPYEVTPTMQNQTLATRERVLLDDVTVNAVPLYEVSNQAGGTTVYIATLEG